MVGGGRPNLMLAQVQVFVPLSLDLLDLTWDLTWTGPGPDLGPGPGPELDNLLTHVQSKHEGVRFPCDQCDYKAVQKPSLVRHIKTVHEGVKFPCEECDYKAAQKFTLMRHKKSKHAMCQDVSH